MPRKSEEERVRSRVREFIDRAVLSKDAHLLNVITVAQSVPCSRTTIYKYGLDKDIIRARKKIKRGPGKIGNEDKPESEIALAKAREEAAEWKRKYLGVVEKLVQIEYHLKGHPSINLDEIYATPIPVPDRSKPYHSTRGRSRKRY
jgi:hypothetical protein